MAHLIRFLVAIFVGMTILGSAVAAERAGDRLGCRSAVSAGMAGSDADVPSMDEARHLFCKLASSIVPATTLPLPGNASEVASPSLALPLDFLAVAPRERPPRDRAAL